MSAVKTYTEGAIAFKLERTEHVKNKRARRWTREKFALATQNLSTLAGFALGKGDVHALPSLHGFLKKRPVQAPEAGGGAFPDSSDEETANSVEDREADWCLAIPGIRKEARKSYIAILTSFALSLAKVATDPVLAGKLETALVKPSDADVGDDSLDQHLSSLSHCLNSVYAVFSCCESIDASHPSRRLRDFLSQMPWKLSREPYAPQRRASALLLHYDSCSPYLQRPARWWLCTAGHSCTVQQADSTGLLRDHLHNRRPTPTVCSRGRRFACGGPRNQR